MSFHFHSRFISTDQYFERIRFALGQVLGSESPVMYVLVRRPFVGAPGGFVTIASVSDTNGVARSMSMNAAGDIFVLVQRPYRFTIEKFTDTLQPTATQSGSTLLCYGVSGDGSVSYTRGSATAGHLFDWLTIMPDDKINVGGVAIGRTIPYGYEYFNQTYQAYSYDYNNDSPLFFRNEIYQVGGNESCGLVGFCEATGIEPLLDGCPQAHPMAVAQYPGGGVQTSSEYVAFTYAASAEYLPRSGRMLAADRDGFVFQFVLGSDVTTGAQLDYDGDVIVLGVGVHVTQIATTTVCLSNPKRCAEKLVTGECLVGGECVSGICANGFCCRNACTSVCNSGACGAAGECLMMSSLADAPLSCSPLPGLADNFVLADFDAVNARIGSG